MIRQELRMTTKAITKLTSSTGRVLVQARAIQGAMSQKKWLIAWGPQKVRLLMRAVGTAMARKPQPSVRAESWGAEGHPGKASLSAFPASLHQEPSLC